MKTSQGPLIWVSTVLLKFRAANFCKFMPGWMFLKKNINYSMSTKMIEFHAYLPLILTGDAKQLQFKIQGLPVNHMPMLHCRPSR